MATDPICGMQVDEQKGRKRPNVTARRSTFAASIAGRNFWPMASHKPMNITRPRRNRPLSKRARSTPAPCIRRSSKSVPGLAPSAACTEPKKITATTVDDDSELVNMTRRFRVAVALSVPVLLLNMLPMLGVPVDHWLGEPLFAWTQLVLSTPVVWWAGWPFLVRFWRSIVTWNLNMFTLIAIGTLAAYLYSLAAVVFPSWIPDDFQQHGHLEVYFEAAAVIVTLVLLGQVLELRARQRDERRDSRTVRALAPDSARGP